MIGQTLKDRYRIEKLIGAGAMGQVFRATDLETFDEVAVKTINVERAANQDDQRRFQREVSALQHLNHPHIARYIDAFDLGENSFLVIEYCGGGTLKQYIQSHEEMPKRIFKDMALKITDAIAAAHDVGIIHRDLKPENILLSEAGEPKVVDFGLARLTGVTTMTQAGTLMGTLAYMPPEAFDPVLRQDHRGDIWALGIIFFQMLTGESPFRASSQSGMISAILNQKPAPLHQLRGGLPREWGDILLGCLEKHPNNRYPTARHLLEDLVSETRTLPRGGTDFFQVSGGHVPVVGEGTIEVSRSQTGSPVESDGWGDLPPTEAEQVRDSLLKLRQGNPPKPPSPLLLIVGRLCSWFGLLGVIGAAMLGFLSVLQSESGTVSFSETAIIMVIAGTALFFVGMFFEVVLAHTQGKFAFIGLTLWIIITAGLVIAGVSSADQVQSLAGLVFSLLLIFMYGGTKFLLAY